MERTLREAQEKGVPEATYTSVWFQDFIQAISYRYEHWAAGFENASEDRVLSGKMTFRDVANKFWNYL